MSNAPNQDVIDKLKEYYDDVAAGIHNLVPEGPDADHVRKLVTYDNVIRTAIEVCIDKSIPFEKATPVEFAMRAASYAISALPVEDQDQAVAFLVQNFAEAHQTRTAKGFVITTEWGDMGENRIGNYPTGKEKPRGGI